MYNIYKIQLYGSPEMIENKAYNTLKITNAMKFYVNLITELENRKLKLSSIVELGRKLAAE